MPGSFERLVGPAELFSRRDKQVGWSQPSLKYRRFESLAEAVKFVVEDAGIDLHTAVIRVDDADFSGDDIRNLYNEDSYPLPRKKRPPERTRSGRKAVAVLPTERTIR